MNTFGTTIFSDWLAFQSARDFRRRIAKVLGQAPNFFIKNSTGSIMSKATNDISAIETLTGYGVLAFFDSTVPYFHNVYYGYYSFLEADPDFHFGHAHNNCSNKKIRKILN